MAEENVQERTRKKRDYQKLLTDAVELSKDIDRKISRLKEKKAQVDAKIETYQKKIEEQHANAKAEEVKRLIQNLPQEELEKLIKKYSA